MGQPTDTELFKLLHTVLFSNSTLKQTSAMSKSASSSSDSKAQNLNPSSSSTLVSVLLHQGEELSSKFLQEMATLLTLEKMGNLLTALVTGAKDTPAHRAEIGKIVLKRAPKNWNNPAEVRQLCGAVVMVPNATLWKNWVDTSKVEEMILGVDESRPPGPICARTPVSTTQVVTDEWLSLVCSLFCSGKFPQVTSLSLSRCSKITDASAIQLACGATQLTSLNLGACWNITDAGVGQLARGARQLTSLNLCCIKKITDAGVSHLARGATQLTSLNLGYTNITDVGVGHLVHLHQLTSLNLAGCEHITDACVSQLACGAAQLTSLNLTGCEHITNECIAASSQTFPKLKFNH